MTLDCTCNRLIEAECKAAKMADMLVCIEAWIDEVCRVCEDTEHGKDIDAFDLSAWQLDIADLLQGLGYASYGMDEPERKAALWEGIVRCGECAYLRDYGEEYGCAIIRKGAFPRDADDFCSLGKRREES